MRNPVCSCTYLLFVQSTSSTSSYTLSLHDALPICGAGGRSVAMEFPDSEISMHMSMFPSRTYKKAHRHGPGRAIVIPDRKSTRLNSSHRCISYAVFCLKKKKKEQGQNCAEHDLAYF